MTDEQNETAALVKTRLEQAAATLNDALILMDGGGQPRSVVNRSYYAAFYALLALLQAKQLPPRSHQGAQQLFDREFVHPGFAPKELSRDLHSLFLMRQEDDYRRLDLVTREEADEALKLARTFIDGAKNCLRQMGLLGI